MDPLSLPANQSCPIARSLAVLGQKWNLLLLREAFFGRTKYAEFQRIGVPSGTLGARLDALVDAGLLERRAYQEKGERTRDEYVLAEAGRDVMPVLAALIQWGETHLPKERGADVTYTTTTIEGSPVRLEFVDDRGTAVSRDAVIIARQARTATASG
ncbi:HxlR family transcriptional regulator [Acrocarpospora phusangensis]|uniref:HxlR family transcriptional regulator n=1 Tax=Acrocarpospora phusangensis TaxID=1070424 RepID=A0A919UMG7_9ACTN|nr:helix-turn-helix domain-containing protein [Acrocarpospora phusangensis]GIH23283.1 HxlR family transcriptional regulator [Acrocarpospora phusangensis]